MPPKKKSPQPTPKNNASPVSSSVHWVTYLPLIIFISSLVFFACSLKPYNIPFGDSDELITTALTNGIAHPPGYLLLLSILKLFAWLPLTLTISLKLPNLIFQSLTLVFLYLITRHILQSLNSEFKSSFSIHLSSLFATIVVAINQTYWFSAITVEKYPLHTLLITSSIYLLLLSTSRRQLVLAIFLTGIALQYHPLTILVLPVYGLILYLRFPRKISTYVLSFFVLVIGFLLPQLLLLTVSPHFAPLTTPLPTDFPSWLNFATKQSYSAPGFFWGINISQLSFTTISNGFTFYLSRLLRDFGWWPIPLAVYGLYQLRHHRHPLFLPILFLLLITGPFLAILNILPSPIQADQYYEQLAITHRTYFLGEVFVGIAIAFGIYCLIFQFKNLTSSRRDAMFCVSAFIALLLITVTSNSRLIAQSHLPSDVTQSWLTQLPPNSLLVCRSDFSCFNLFYRKFVEHQIPDTTIMVYDRTLFANYYQNLPPLSTFQYPQFPEQLVDTLMTQIGQGRRVFFIDLDPVLLDYLGVLGNPFFLLPYQNIFELTTQIPTQAPPLDQVSLQTQTSNFPWYTFVSAKVQSEHQARIYLLNKYNFPDAIARLPSLPATTPSYLLPFTDPTPRQRLDPGTLSPSAEQLFQQALVLQKSGQHNIACQRIRAASWRDLKNDEVRRGLIDCYRRFQSTSLLELETKHLAL